MATSTFDFLSIKAAGVYTQEIDNSTRTTVTTNALRLIPGFSVKGPFNRPVWLETNKDRVSIFGDVDTKMEHKGCFFNRMLRTSLSTGPVIALNLLNTDDTYSGPDQVNYAALSLDAATPNPAVSTSKKYGEYNYSYENDECIYGSEQDVDMIPYVGNTPFASVYNRSRFWVPDKDLLTGVAARGTNSSDYTTGSGSFEHSNLLNFANVGTEEFSILVFKAENLTGYDITVESWYGGIDNIPFGWVRPSDYVSDYFIQVVAVKGNWSNYPVLATDPVWKAYFNTDGLIKSKLNNFMNADGITMIGTWTGCIIPDFVNKQGDNMFIETKVNAQTEKTGILMSLNTDALHVLTGDYTGIDNDGSDSDNIGQFTWGIDIDGDNEIDSINGESASSYIIDMVGHGLYQGDDEYNATINYEFVSASYDAHEMSLIDEDNVKHDNIHTIIETDAIENTSGANLVLLQYDGKTYDAKLTKYGTVTKTRTVTDSVSGLESEEEYEEDAIVEYPTDGHGFATGVYLPQNFFNLNNVSSETAPTQQITKQRFIKSTFTDVIGKYAYVLSVVDENTDNVTYTIDRVDVTNKQVDFYDVDEEGNKKGTQDIVVKQDNTYTARLTFNINGTTYLAYFTYSLTEVKNNKYVYNMKPGCEYEINATSVSSVSFTAEETAKYIDITPVSSDEYPVSVMPTNDGYTEIPELAYVLRPMGVTTDGSTSAENHVKTIGFLSYYYKEDLNDTSIEDDAKMSLPVTTAYLFNDDSLWVDAKPVSDVSKNMFIVLDGDQWDNIKVGSYVRNAAFYNEEGVANKLQLIPGLTRVISKRFVPVDAAGNATYLGKVYETTLTVDDLDTARGGATGFYLYTTVDPVLIEDVELSTGEVSKGIYRQLPLTDSNISKVLRFIPLKGLKITSRHKPGYDLDGNISIEDGIEKIYAVLADSGVRRGLCNPAMVDFRYIVDTMSYGLETGLGGKKYLSELAQDRASTLAVLNMPSAKQFAVSSNPYFCDSYITGTEIRPSFDTKYIPDGGNQEMGSSRIFSLPDEDSGSKYAAAFWPNLIYTEGGRKISVPPAADVTNVLASKFTGVNSPYAINANQNGIIKNSYVSDIEYDADTTDRGYLEPFGVNTIIKENGQIMIYGNQTCYQTVKSDLNKLHVRETLNTIEIECNAILKQFNFKYNTADTRAAIIQILTPVLSVIQTSGAIDSYTITCDETNNTAEMIENDFGIVDIGVTFNHGMEKILTRITINRYSSDTDSDTDSE
jgi:hypothetical protein